MLFFPATVLLGLLTGFVPLTAQAAQGEGVAEQSLPFGGRVSETAALRIATTTAWLAALDRATSALSNARLVQLGASETVDKLALVSSVFTPNVSSTSTGQRVSVQVRLMTPQRTVDDRLRRMLHEREMLALRAEMLKLEKKKAAEAFSLVQLSAANQASATGAGTENEVRLGELAAQLEALWLLGITLPQREGGHWRDPLAALSVLQQALVLDPHYAPLHYLRGEILLQLDRPQDAIKGFNTTLDLNPELSGALYARGLAYLRLKLVTLADRDLSAALARDDTHAAWWRARGAVRMIRNEIAPMCEDFAQACARGDCEGLAVTRGRGLCPAEHVQ